MSFNKVPAANLVMYEITGDSKYKQHLQSWERMRKNAPHTPNGMIHLNQWGSARHATNVGFLTMVAYKKGYMGDYGLELAESQLKYVLGWQGKGNV